MLETHETGSLLVCRQLHELQHDREQGRHGVHTGPPLRRKVRGLDRQKQTRNLMVSFSSDLQYFIFDTSDARPRKKSTNVIVGKK